MADNEGDRTEDPTQKRLNEARERGNLPISRELNHWFGFLGAALLMLVLAPSAASDLVVALRPFIASSDQIVADRYAMGRALSSAVSESFKAIGLALGLLLVTGLASSLIQAGFNISAENLKPKFSKINPFEGLKRLFAPRAVGELLKSIAKLVIIATVSTAVIMPSMGGIERFATLEPVAFAAEFRTLTIRLIAGVLAIMTIITAADIFLVRWAWWKKLKMSKQEVKDEHKQSEGSPEIKQRQRQLRFDKARKRILQAVPRADVIITNPTHYAVALRYDPDKMRAPVLVAKGVDFLAARIREVAAQHDIPISENPPLARAIYATVDIDEEIKEDQYRAVAEIISYVFKLKKRVLSM